MGWLFLRQLGPHFKQLSRLFGAKQIFTVYLLNVKYFSYMHVHTMITVATILKSWQLLT